MNKQLKVFLCVALVAAIALVAVCGLRLYRLRAELVSAERLLSESRSNWEAIAAEKETLQAELKEVQNNLKEANLSVEEITELKNEIEDLRKQVEDLKKED